jgi:hypothetical protein
MTRLTCLALDLMIAFSRILSTLAQLEIKTASSKPKTPTLVVELDSDTRENGCEVHKTTFGWGFSMCMIDMCQVIKEVQMVSRQTAWFPIFLRVNYNLQLSPKTCCNSHLSGTAKVVVYCLQV